MKDTLAEFAASGVIPAADSELPDLGPLPPPSPELSAASPEQEVEDGSADEEDEEEEEEEEEEDDDDEEETTKKRRGSGRGRRTTRGGSTQPRATRRRGGGAGNSTAGEVKDEDVEEGSGRKIKDDPRRKRGRPPRVDTPMEIRIKNILKALRKLKDGETGQQRITAFEKLPEKKEFPEYFQEIKNPIALDIVRKNVKRRVYKTLEQFVKDMELMFGNAKAFNEDDSQLYKDAVMLQKELRSAAAIEKAKTDEELAGGDEGAGHNKNMRIPLDKIEHKGDTYRVGDWIHIVNPNDPNKPTVAQIFRTWKDLDGRVWINACWYYRPEQTVHWVEKKFFPDEVVKTGQYRDHSIDEVLGKCFVMFFTRYSRGRPKGIDENNCPIYVCESRYNENEKHFNKIKTWKSCIPDEVHNQDYELDPFDKQRTLKKVPSPIAHLLPPDAKESDPLPEAKMGVDNAPPVIGAVFKRARRDTVSSPVFHILVRLFSNKAVCASAAAFSYKT
ncbi:hypothetical protein K440DRAFT_542050 [Wilcoxina mikolae CBS 423.85]|nr:hypothetical protein K440DRAFT_542050 [Wilcoxina mikolae CBS 423.85]